MDALDIVGCIVSESGKQSDRHIRIKSSANVNVRCESALNNQAFRLDLSCQVGCDGSTERPTEDDNIVRWYCPFFGQPFVCSLCVQVRALFGWLAITITVAAIVKDEAIQSKIMKDAYAVQAVHNVAAVAVTKKYCKLCIFCGNVPTVQS